MRKRTFCRPIFFTFLLIAITVSVFPGSFRDDGHVLIAAPGIADPSYPINDSVPETTGYLPNVCEGLVRFKPGNCEVMPCLATGWDLSQDGRTWTFTLRSGVRFHDGTPLNPGLVRSIFSEKMIAAGKSPNANLLFCMIEKVTVIDSRHVAFRLRYPYTPFLRNLALPQGALILPGNPPSGTGPYRIASNKPGEIILKSVPTYWDRLPEIQNIRIISVPDVSKRLRILHSRKGVIALGISPVSANDLAPERIIRSTAASLGYLGFYTDKRPFDNPDARRLVSMAIDRRLICRTLFNGLLPDAGGPLPPVVFGNSPRDAITPADKQKISVLFNKQGLTGREFTLLSYSGTRPYNPAGGSAFAEEVRRQLQSAGLKVGIRCYQWDDLKAAISRGEGDFFLYGWVSDNGDPDNFLYSLLARSQIKSGFNTTRYDNPVLDILLTRARQIPDSDMRAKIYRQVQEITARDLPFISINYGAHIAACSSDLKGLSLYSIGTYDLHKLVRAR
ncbi:MAG: ABC transporter substrate-binding protein [Bacillota bacterium]